MVRTHAQQVRTKEHGSPSYMAPELLASNGRTNITPKVDVWALGCIMHELATLEVTFFDPEENLKKIEERIMLNGPGKIPSTIYSR